MSTASGDDYIVVDPSVFVGAEAVPAARETQPSRFQWPFLLVAGLGLASLVLVVAGSLRAGIAGLVLAMALAAALRLVLPARTSELLSSRHRIVDAACFAALAAGLAGTLLLLS